MHQPFYTCCRGKSDISPPHPASGHPTAVVSNAPAIAAAADDDDDDDDDARMLPLVLRPHRVSCELADALLTGHVPHAQAAATKDQLGAICSSSGRRQS
jgi:hypothetical protein